jgi:hypothetical protein
VPKLDYTNYRCCQVTDEGPQPVHLKQRYFYIQAGKLYRYVVHNIGATAFLLDTDYKVCIWVLLLQISF